MNQTTVIMKGAEVANHMLSNLSWKKDTTLYILSNQADPASAIYVCNKKRKCDEIGVQCIIYDISQIDIESVENILYKDIINNSFNLNKFYVIIQKPLPNHLKKYEQKIDNFFKIYPNTDIDAFGGDLSTEFNTPATPLGIMKMLDYYIGIKNLDGKNAVILGRSPIVGKPIADLLLNANCTVTICHSHTKDLKKITRRADLIVSAVGRPKFITPEFITPDRHPIIVDVGINKDENGKMCGDVDFNTVAPYCSYISPVPGGVGILTVASLAYKMRETKENM